MKLDNTSTLADMVKVAPPRGGRGLKSVRHKTLFREQV